MDDEALSFLDLASLEQVRLARREALQIAARRAVTLPGGTLLSDYEYLVAKKALESVDAEIAKRKSVE